MDRHDQPPIPAVDDEPDIPRRAIGEYGPRPVPTETLGDVFWRYWFVHGGIVALRGV
jgi:hypothetical protein